MTIELHRSPKTRQYHVRIRARNGRILLSSEGYRRIRSARTMIVALLIGLPRARLVILKSQPNRPKR